MELINKKYVKFEKEKKIEIEENTKDFLEKEERLMNEIEELKEESMKKKHKEKVKRRGIAQKHQENSLNFENEIKNHLEKVKKQEIELNNKDFQIESLTQQLKIINNNLMESKNINLVNSLKRNEEINLSFKIFR